MRKPSEYQPSKKQVSRDPQSYNFERSNKVNDMESTVLCETMFELWLKKQSSDDQVIIVLLRGKYEPKKIMEICGLSAWKFRVAKARLNKSLKVWFEK